MKTLCFFLVGLIILCSCHKNNETIAPEKISYPYKDRYAGTIHVYQLDSFYSPHLIYDTAYQQVFDIVYPDSNRVFFNLYYWNYDMYVKSGIASYTRTLSSVSGTFPVGSNRPFTINISPLCTVNVSEDSLKVTYPAVNNTYHMLNVTFSGKKSL